MPYGSPLKPLAGQDRREMEDFRKNENKLFQEPDIILFRGSFATFCGVSNGLRGYT
jgi:hypothetical protein